MRKGDTLSPREEKRMIKVRVTSRKKGKGEKCKEKESKNNQKEVIETEPRQETTHISND